MAAAAAWLVAAGCGGDSDDTPDAAVDRCGNGRLDFGEQCDDGNTNDDDECTTACVFACGDGIVQASETCDVGIAAGEAGACPMASGDCDDGDACTVDGVTGERCTAQCDHQIIESLIDGDGCCPAVDGAIERNDFDCAPVCGNGILELSETCDTAIPAGEPGACPTDCDDGQPCTDDTLVVPEDIRPGDGACRATCEYAPRTVVENGDGCCAPGADPTTDDDCATGTAVCGDGTFQPGRGERCDTAIAAGEPGACPTECPTDDACTRALLLSAGTCKAQCWQYPVTATVSGDECCPVFYGGNNRTDGDCETSCGTPAQECELGTDDCDENCRIERTAFRIVSLSLADPHIFWDAGNGNCPDLTSTANNTVFPDAIQQDADMDGFADLTILNVMKPLNQVDGESTAMDIVFGNCLPNADPAMTQCTADPLTPRISVTATNAATGTCLDVVANTVTDAYMTPPAAVDGPCFATGAFDAPMFQLGSLTVPLQSARIAGTYDADPATGLVNGLLLGFVSESDAAAATIPDSVLLIGGKTLAEVLAGGIAPGSCDVTAGNPIGDDRDVGPDGTTRGWYFYVNFTAAVVPFDDRPTAGN